MTTVVDSTKPKKLLMGIDPKKIDRGHLDAVAETMGIKPNGLDHTVQKLCAKFVEDAKGENLLRCDNCGGMSPKELDVCPFCGVGEDDEEESLPEAEVSSALVPAAEAERMLGTGERQLDEAVARVRAIKIKTVEDMAEMTREISIIFESQLWKHRLREGKPAHRAWNDFVVTELEMSSRFTFKLMSFMKECSAEQLQNIGVRKIELLLTVPAEHRKPLVEAAANGESIRKLESKVREINAGRKKKPGRPQKLEKVEERKNEITLATLTEAKHTLALYKPGKKGEEPVAAKKYEDGAWAFLDLPNGVRLLMQLVGGVAGKPKIRFSASREE